MKAPSVIIGVGGIGSQICSKVEKQLRRVKKQKTGQSLEQENTRFVVLDTDVNSLRELYRHGFQGKRILMTDNMTVAKCRDIIDDASIDEWYPDNSIFSKKSMTEGAGQQRSISRLAFDYCIRDGRLNKLDSVIRELNEMSIEDSSQQTRFYIISSLAGGTGSGVILPLAMYLNRFIKEEQGDDLGICKGFFVLSNAFYDSCGSELEKKSLDANAYAAIKELSAFMRSADDTTMPPLSYPLSDYGNYTGSTYEYCYLFGMTNANSKNIHSFEDLKNMIADAVYMQACSPMHDRNSSREDNTVRHTTMLGQENQENWRRRFGGIGCGRLLYPYEELNRYFGLRWARDIMDKKWRKYDEEYKRAKKALKIQQGKKNKTVWIDQGNYYINSIDTADFADQQANFIKNECKKQNGKYPWEHYLEALKGELKNRLRKLKEPDGDKDTSEWHASDSNLDNLMGGGTSKEKKKERYNIVKKLEKNTPNLIKELENYENIMYAENNLFQLHIKELPESEDIEELSRCYLEHWLFTEDGQFFHPNSVRYFLYKLEQLIIFNKENRHSDSQKKRKALEDVLIHAKSEYLSKRKGDRYAQQYRYARDDFYKEIQYKVENWYIDKCELYVKSLIRCYEEFYGSYDMILDEFNADIQTIERKLDKVSGISYSYVCADSVCREGLHEELSNRRCYDEGAVSNISYELYRLMHEEKLKSTKMSTKECADKIKEFWYQSIQREEIGKEILDMNILKAMNQEGKYHTGKDLTEDGFQEKIQRVQEVLVAPFLQYFQRIDMNLGISLCCYHNNLKCMSGVYRNVVRWLDGHNAVDDDTYCSDKELLFYRSFVGLEAYEVLDYLHGIPAKKTINGRAFRSYQEVLKNMGKNTGNASKVITPHADTRWHSLYDMPDPSVRYQQEQENLITVAVLYAWLSNKLRYDKINKAYSFSIGKDIKYFERLCEFHRYLYGNSYWYIELYQNMIDTLEDARAKNLDCYEIITNIEEKHYIFGIYIRYQAELSLRDRDDKQKRMLVDAIKNIICQCTDSKESCKQYFKTAMQEIDDIIKKINEDSETPINIDDKLKQELKSYVEYYIVNV